MKKKLIFAALAAIIALTACQANKDENKESVTVSITAEERLEPAPAETESTLHGIGDYTETTIEQTEAQTEADEAPSMENVNVITYEAIENSVGGNVCASKVIPLNEDTVVLTFNIYDYEKDQYGNDLPTTGYTLLRYINIEDSSLIKEIALDKGITYDSFELTDNGILLGKSYNYVEDKGIVVTTAYIYDDYTYEIVEGETVKAFYNVGEHHISEIGDNIVNADTSEILIERYIHENNLDSFYNTYPKYLFTVDDERFIYRTVGYESLPGFGIYDFSEGKATDIPGTENLMPIDIVDGKVYSVYTAWDDISSNTICVTDIETFETEKFYSREEQDQLIYSYALSEDKKSLIEYRQCQYNYAGMEELIPGVLRKIDIESGEVTEEFELGEASPSFANSTYTFADDVLYIYSWIDPQIAIVHF